jgi:hypothetical protein
MATTQQKQAEARAKKKADAFFAKLTQPNTTSWVDGGYSRLLAAQLYQKLQAAAGDMHRTAYLNAVRKDFSYVCEEPIRNGVRVWFLDNSVSRPGTVVLSSYDYDINGKFVKESLATTCGQVLISKHGLERTYERLRSNSLTDAKDVIKQLLVLMKTPPKEVGEETEVKVPDGTFYLVGDTMDLAAGRGIPLSAPDHHPVVMHYNPGTPQYQQVLGTVGELRAVMCHPFWVVRTYIADKK